MMMVCSNAPRITTLLAVLLAVATPAAADDWPHLRGPSYAGTSAEIGRAHV